MLVSGKKGGRIFLFLACFWFWAGGAVFLSAQTPDIDNSPFLSALGLNPAEVIDSFGSPEEILPFRGGNDREDMVVFYYPKHFYVFFFENRVWQIRFDHRYKEEVCSCTLGMTKREILSRLGYPFSVVKDSFIYHYSDQGYPVKARLFFRNGRLDDVYVFRGDY